MNGKSIEALWKVIGRYDFYFNTTNTKGAFLIAFHTFVLGFVAVQVGNVDQLTPTTAPTARILLMILAGIVGIGTLIPLALVIAVISPYLKSSRKLGSYHSIIFFGDVAQHEKPEDYLEQIGTYSEEKLQEDLARQTYVLAKGLARKFSLMRYSVLWTLWLQLPALAALLVFVLVRKM